MIAMCTRKLLSDKMIGTSGGIMYSSMMLVKSAGLTETDLLKI